MPKQTLKSQFAVTAYQASPWNNIYRRRVSRDPVADLQTDLPLWRNTAKFLFQTVSEVFSSVTNSSSLIIGRGLKATPRITLNDRKASQAVRAALGDYWDGWASSAHIDGQQDLNSVLRAIVAAILRDGDVLVHLCLSEDDTLKIDLIDAERVQTPPPEMIPSGRKVYLGVQTYRRKVEGYWIASNVGDKDGFTFAPAFDENGVIHNVLLKNPGNSYLLNSYRGVPVIASIINTVDQLSKLKDAELQSSILKTKQVGIYSAQNLNIAKKALRGKTAADTPAKTPAEETAAIASEVGNIPVSKVSETNILIIPAGDTLEMVKGGDVSNPQITALVNLYYRTIASVFGISSEVLFSILGDANYSSNIAMRQSAYENTSIWREYLSRNLLSPIYSILMQYAVSNGAIKGLKRWNKEVSGVEFIGAGQNAIKPKEVYDIYESSIKLGLKSHVQAANETGLDAYSILEEELNYQETERQMRIARGLEVLDALAIEKNAQILTIVSKVSSGSISKESASIMLQTLYCMDGELASLMVNGIQAPNSIEDK